MKRSLRILFTLLMIMAMVMTYSAVTFADDLDVVGNDDTTETTVDETDPAAAEPADVTDQNDPEETGDGTTSDTGETDDNIIGDDSEGTGSVGLNSAGTVTTQDEPGDGNGGDDPGADDPKPGLADYTLYVDKYFAYTGSYIEPGVVLNAPEGAEELTEGTDYEVSYENNKGGGTATVTVTGLGDYADTTLTDNFYIIGSAKKITYKDGVKNRKSTSINVKWNKYSTVPVDGYKVFVNGTLKYTVKDVATTNKVVSGLKADTSYTIEVAPYATYENNDGETVTVIGYKGSATLYTAPSVPGKVTLLSAKTVKPYVLVKWKKASSYTAKGFEIQYSKNSDFSASKSLMISGNTVVSNKVYNLINKRKYYFRVRSYRKGTGGYSFGAWSGKKYATAKSTCWITSGSKKYYYRNGKKLTGQQTLGKEPYYFDEETGEYHGADGNIWKRVKGSTSKTKYLVTISIDYHRVNVYTKKNGVWTPRNQWKCITGYYDTTKWGKKFTPRGSWLISGKKLKWMRNDGHTCYYATNFYGGCYIHSELYRDTDLEMKNPIDGHLGGSYSSGCVRIYKDNALWVYNNIKKGTRVISYCSKS